MEVGRTEEAKEVWVWGQESLREHIQDDAGILWNTWMKRSDWEIAGWQEQEEMVHTINWWHKKVKVSVVSRVRLFAIPWSVHGILQARILEWVAIPFSRGSSQPKNRTQVFCIEGTFFAVWATLANPKFVFYICDSTQYFKLSSNVLSSLMIAWKSGLCRLERSRFLWVLA